MNSSLESAIKDAISPIVAEAGFFLEALQISTAGKHRLIRVLVDRLEPTSPLSLDEVTSITKPISASLDELSILGERAFTLEVSSPGVDFPLSLPRHWAKNQNRLVDCALRSGEALRGRIASSDNESVTLTVKDSRRGMKEEISRKVRFDEIAHANVEIEFS